MNLVDYPTTINQLWKLQTMPFIILIVAMLFISILKRTTNLTLFSRIKAIDLFPIFAFYIIYQITVNKHGVSVLPYLIFGWAIIGIIWLFKSYFKSKPTTKKSFLIAFWRFGDLYFLFFYIIILIYAILIRL